jgi:F-type H+-transporting ATPase subunit gamma
MANTRDIRNRIKGVRNTGKITRAMQLVAASKMKRAQDRALEGRPYNELMARLLVSLNGQSEEFSHPFMAERPVRTRGVLLITTDRGLCGSLNANLLREAARLDKAQCAFITIGRKGRQFVARTQRRLLADFTVPETVTFRDVRPVVEYLLEAFRSGEIDTIDVLYPRFRNTLIQEPVLMPVLPLTHFQEQLRAMAAEAKFDMLQDNREYLFEPAANLILEQLLDLFIKREIFQLINESRASEHSSRMVAMKAATDNARKLADGLTLQYNKARQAGITQEILEITAATLHS